MGHRFFNPPCVASYTGLQPAGDGGSGGAGWGATRNLSSRAGGQQPGSSPGARWGLGGQRDAKAAPSWGLLPPRPGNPGHRSRTAPGYRGELRGDTCPPPPCVQTSPGVVARPLPYRLCKGRGTPSAPPPPPVPPLLRRLPVRPSPRSVEVAATAASGGAGRPGGPSRRSRRHGCPGCGHCAATADPPPREAEGGGGGNNAAVTQGMAGQSRVRPRLCSAPYGPHSPARPGPGDPRPGPGGATRFVGGGEPSPSPHLVSKSWNSNNKIDKNY